MWWSTKYEVPEGTTQIHLLNLADCYKAVKHILEEEEISEEWYKKWDGVKREKGRNVVEEKEER